MSMLGIAGFALMILIVVLMLTLTKVATHVTFMVALAIGLMVNYPSQKAQTERIKAHATDALTMAFTALASGVLIGIMGKSPMLMGAQQPKMTEKDWVKYVLRAKERRHCHQLHAD